MFICSKGKPKTFNPIMKPREYIDNRKEKKMHRGVDGVHKVASYLNKPDMVKIGNIWAYNNAGGQNTKDACAYEHPAIFPEKLVEDSLLTWSTENDIVCDCFLGSGTVLKMCRIHNRIPIGIEISQKYCELARKRAFPYGLNRDNIEIVGVHD
jgi:site-specific DNA-methyltransferase (adenine-specific)